MIERLTAKNADVLLEMLGPGSTQFSHSSSRAWLFRGQGSAAWRLVPKAFRDGTRFPFHFGHEMNWLPSTAFGSSSERMQRIGELCWLDLFLSIANDHGYALPGDGVAVMRRVRDYKNTLMLFDHPERRAFYPPTPDIKSALLEHWPPNDLLPFVGFAQHFGVPTRLLDFSWNPLVAVYFAARSAVDCQQTSFAIWAINWDSYIRRSCATPQSLDGVPELKVVTISGSINDRVSAQSSAFLVWVDSSQSLESIGTAKANKSSIDERMLAALDSQDAHEPIVRVVECPTEHAGTVLRKLHRVGISAASVSRDLRGVFDSACEMEHWDQRCFPEATQLYRVR